MLEGLWYGIAAAFIFIGVVATSCFVILQVFKFDNDANCVVVISSGMDDDDVGTLLYSVHLRFALLGDCRKNRIVIVDNGMTEKQKTLCLNIMKEFDNMELCAPDDLLMTIIGKEQ